MQNIFSFTICTQKPIYMQKKLVLLYAPKSLYMQKCNKIIWFMIIKKPRGTYLVYGCFFFALNIRERAIVLG